jgi:RNA polymerase sigma-70 factor (ECF subfamily)
MEFESDENLVRLAERGGKAGSRAVEMLFRRHLPRVYSLSRRYFAVREDAEEATSETFLRAFLALANGRFRGESRFATWLMRIGGNTCIERLRQPRLPTLSLEGLYEIASAPCNSPIGRGEGRVEEAIRELPDDQNLAITLCDLEGYSAKEAAEIMGRSPEAVKSLNYRARRAVRDRLAAWHDADQERER